MFKRSKTKLCFIVLCILVLLLSMIVPTFAATSSEEATNSTGVSVREIAFSAECPPDFDHVIIVTATSVETGYMYSFYLRKENNYEGYFYIPFGSYKIAASVSKASNDAEDDGLSYVVTPAADIFQVNEPLGDSSSIPALGLTVEVYSKTDQEDDPSVIEPSSPGTNSSPNDKEPNENGENNTEPSNPSEIPGDTEIDTELPDDNLNDYTDNDFVDDTTEPNKGVIDTSTPTEPKKSNLLSSFLFSCCVILIFFICGQIYRKHKEGY